MLEYIEQRSDIGIPNVQTILADPDDPKLPADRLELILVLNTWHHIKKRGAYLKHLEASLRPSGRVVSIDIRVGEVRDGPCDDEKQSRGQVVREFDNAGWTLTSESVALTYQYLLILRPPAADPS